MSVSKKYRFGEGFQRLALAVLARVPGAVIRYRSALRAEYFEREDHRIVATSLLNFVDTNRTLPTEEVLVELTRDITPVAEREQVEEVVRSLYNDDITNVDAVCSRLVEFGRNRAIIEAVVAGAEEISKGDSSRLMPRLRDSMLVGEDVVNVGLDYNSDEEFNRRADRYRNPARDLDQRIRTGIQHLDYALRGGPKRKTLNVVLGVPKAGKSTALLNIAHGALTSIEPRNVVYYSHEMYEDDVVERMDVRFVGKNACYKETDPERFINDLRVARKRYLRGGFTVKSYPTRTAGVSNLRSNLSILAAKGFAPDVIVADYADIMRGERRLKSEEMRHIQAGIYEDLRALAGEFNAVVWTASQAKVSACNKALVTMADFAEAFEKAAIVDLGVALCMTREEEAQEICRFYIALARGYRSSMTIECDYKLDRYLIRSRGLFDAAFSRVAIDDSDADGSPTPLAIRMLRDDKANGGGDERSAQVQRRFPKRIAL